MKKKALISVRAHQYIDGDVNRSETRSEGIAVINGNSVSLRYRDDLGDGTETDCEITSSEKKLEIKRNGCVRTVLVVEEGVCHRGVYKTLYGEFPVEVTGKKLSVIPKEDKLEITAYYYLVLGSGEPLLNKVNITAWYGDTVNE